MESGDWRRILKNWPYLRSEIQLEDGNLLSELFQKRVLSDAEYKMIKGIPLESERTEKLLFALKSKSPQMEAFKHFCDGLREIQPHVVEKLDATPVDSGDSQEYDVMQAEDIIRQTLLDKFLNRKGLSCKLPDVKRVINESLESAGTTCDWNERRIKEFIINTFTDVAYKQGSKSQIPCFQNLGIKGTQKKDTPAKESDASLRVTEADIEAMSVDALCSFLQNYAASIDNIHDIIKVCKQERISGEVFLSLTEKDILEIFSSMKFGQKRSLQLLISKLKSVHEGEKEVKVTQTKRDVELERKDQEFDLHAAYQESLRSFDKPAGTSNSYTKGRIVKTDEFTRGNMIHPVRRFVHFQEPVEYLSKIAEETVAFSAACMNERINGTIYFGISSGGSLHLKPGEIAGCRVDKDKCVDAIRQKVKDSFTSTYQHEAASKVIRDPQFIEVIEGAGSHQCLFVVEVDVVPASNMVKNEVFGVKSKFPNSKKNKVRIFRYKDENIEAIEAAGIAGFSTKVHELTTLRKTQEDLNLAPKIPTDQRRKFLNLFTGGSETMEDDVYPVVLFSPLDEKMDAKFISENLSFVKDIDTTAIFDFDPHSDTKGLYHYVNSEDNVVQVLTTDNFDKNGEENMQRKEKHATFLENLRFSSLKTWTFCNGYECMEKYALDPYEWKRKRIEGFRGAVQFHYDDIPQGRAIVLVFLFSKNYEVMLEAADEIFTKFKDQWIIIAENEGIAELWKEQMIARHCADTKMIKDRCVFGIPWNHLNETICQVISPFPTSAYYLPTSTGMHCRLKERVRQDMCDLDILSTQQCSGTEIASDPTKREQKRREVEETFFRGGEVDWWNFWFSDDHVLKRECHSNLMDEVKSALTKTEEYDDRVKVVTLQHQPGAGGTTSARQVLWDLKNEYRCCVVKRITDQTCEQISNLRTYEDVDHAKPLLVLIDNEDDEKVSNLYAVLEDKARIAARNLEDPLAVFCVLLICQRKASLPVQSEGRKVQLKHELTRKELAWFEAKNAVLEKKYKEDNKVNPKYLISFNILKANFNTEYVQRTVRTFVRDIKDEKEQKVLKYLSLLNTYDVDFTHIPVACFDAIMQKQKGGILLFKTGYSQRNPIRQKGWETSLSSPLRVLLNRSSRSTGKGSKMQTLRIINYLMAKEILNNLQKMLEETLVDMMNQLLDSHIFLCESEHTALLLMVIRNIIKKRCYMDDKKEKFSPFILTAMNDVDIDDTAYIMIKVFEMSEDANIAQQIARFYIHTKNWSQAENYARIATQKQYRNSFFWDTYAIVYKEQLFDEYTESSKTDSKIDDNKARKIIQMAFTAVQLYRKEQTISEEEKSAVNNAGYFGEIRVILLLLSIFPKFQCFKGKQDMHRFLVEEKFVPISMKFVGEADISHLKSMQTDGLKALRRLDEEFHQLKNVTAADFVPKDPHLNRDCLIKLKENLDNYFGENFDKVPSEFSLSDAAEYRRRRVRSLGITSLAGALRLKQNGEESLLKAYELMSENIKSPHTNAFDFVTLLNTAIAYYAITNKRLMNVSFQSLVDWSNRLYDLRQQQGMRPFLETYMYLVLFNLPTEERQKYNLCVSSRLEEAIKLWKEAFYKNHPRQRNGERYIRKKDANYFFLGKGQDMAEIVYYEELQGLKGGKTEYGDRLWRTERALNRFRRMKGVLLRDGLEISMQLTSAGGNTFNVAIPTSLPIRKRSLWQKTVFFVLGFGWSGPKAYDVTDEDVQDTEHVKNPLNREWALRPLPVRHRSPTVTRSLGDIMKSIRDKEAELLKIKRESKGGKVGTEEKTLLKKLEILFRERNDLLGDQ